MAKVFFLHWNKDEAAELVKPLRDAGHSVAVHFDTSKGAKPKSLPEVFVISLERLPSHGRAVAEWFWEAKSRQSIPLIFAGGEPAKVAVVRAKFPEAEFCKLSDMTKAVARAAP